MTALLSFGAALVIYGGIVFARVAGFRKRHENVDAFRHEVRRSWDLETFKGGYFDASERTSTGGGE
jgi:hypothetical protein